MFSAQNAFGNTWNYLICKAQAGLCYSRTWPGLDYKMHESKFFNIFFTTKFLIGRDKCYHNIMGLLTHFSPVIASDETYYLHDYLAEFEQFLIESKISNRTIKSTLFEYLRILAFAVDTTLRTAKLYENSKVYSKAYYLVLMSLTPSEFKLQGKH